MEQLLTVYAVRHLPSIQNVQGRGPTDTDLAQGFETYKGLLVDLVRAIGSDKIDYVITGNLKRHRGTTEQVLNESGYTREIIEDGRLNAFLSGYLLEQPAEVTEKEIYLKRFKANFGKFYKSCDLESVWDFFGFDPVELGIFPFNPLYSHAYFDRRLRNIILQSDSSLASFQDIRGNIRSYQSQWIQSVRESSSPLTVLSIGSCSPNAFNLEYCLFGTIGENLVTLNPGRFLVPTKFGTENRVIFPQGHDEVMIMGYRKEDLEAGRERLVAIEGNVKIKGLVDKLHGR